MICCIRRSFVTKHQLPLLLCTRVDNASKARTEVRFALACIVGTSTEAIFVSVRVQQVLLQRITDNAERKADSAGKNSCRLRDRMDNGSLISNQSGRVEELANSDSSSCGGMYGIHSISSHSFTVRNVFDQTYRRPHFQSFAALVGW